MKTHICLFTKAESIVNEENIKYSWVTRYIQGMPFDIRFIRHSFENENYHIEISGPDYINYSDGEFEKLRELQEKLKEIGFKRFGKTHKYFISNLLGDRYYRAVIKLKESTHNT